MRNSGGKKQSKQTLSQTANKSSEMENPAGGFVCVSE